MVASAALCGVAAAPFGRQLRIVKRAVFRVSSDSSATSLTGLGDRDAPSVVRQTPRAAGPIVATEFCSRFGGGLGYQRFPKKRRVLSGLHGQLPPWCACIPCRHTSVLCRPDLFLVWKVARPWRHPASSPLRQTALGLCQHLGTYLCSRRANRDRVRHSKNSFPHRKALPRPLNLSHLSLNLEAARNLLAGRGLRQKCQTINIPKKLTFRSCAFRPRSVRGPGATEAWWEAGNR